MQINRILVWSGTSSLSSQEWTKHFGCFQFLVIVMNLRMYICVYVCVSFMLQLKIFKKLLRIEITGSYEMILKKYLGIFIVLYDCLNIKFLNKLQALNSIFPNISCFLSSYLLLYRKYLELIKTLSNKTLGNTP